VDVITMSATPIPRTLHMSLLGLRDMSVIETPPKDRLSIHTVVAPFQPELIKSAHRTGTGARRPGLFRAQPGRFHLARAAMMQELFPGFASAWDTARWRGGTGKVMLSSCGTNSMSSFARPSWKTAWIFRWPTP
jgi:hypothetical protein